MTNDELNEYEMLSSTEMVLNNFSESVNSIPALAEAKSNFCASVSVIDQKNKDYRNLQKGTTKQKKNTAKNLIKEMFTICSLILVYARKIGNNKIIEMIDVSESDLKKLRGKELRDKGKEVSDLLASEETNLVSYGIGTEEKTTYNNAFTAYDNAFNNKKKLHIESVTSRADLTVEFKKVRETLSDLDNLMGIMEKKNPDFFKQYKQARIIIDLGVRHNPDDDDDDDDNPSQDDSSDKSNDSPKNEKNDKKADEKKPDDKAVDSDQKENNEENQKETETSAAAAGM